MSLSWYMVMLALLQYGLEFWRQSGRHLQDYIKQVAVLYSRTTSRLADTFGLTQASLACYCITASISLGATKEPRNFSVS